jgi:hypothetical protein
MFRSTGGRRRLSARVLLSIAAPLVLLVSAATAQATEPTGAFKVFAQCPRFSGVRFCLYAQVESGEVKVGSQSVPINADKKHELVLQGGYTRNSETGEEHFSGALNGETLSKTPQNVPGGLAGLINCTEITGGGLVEIAARVACKAVFENALTGVSSTAELALPATSIGISSDNLINEEGVALSLPLKLHLENPLLGSECYIGSSSSPVTFNLTTGTTSPPEPNKPISGKLGEVAFLESEGIEYTQITNTTLVDNAFSTPGASGCGGIFSFLLDPIIDAKLGLPSVAGHNTTIQNGKETLTLAEHVIASER